MRNIAQFFSRHRSTANQHSTTEPHRHGWAWYRREWAALLLGGYGAAAVWLIFQYLPPASIRDVGIPGIYLPLQVCVAWLLFWWGGYLAQSWLVGAVASSMGFIWLLGKIHHWPEWILVGGLVLFPPILAWKVRAKSLKSGTLLPFS